LAARSIARVTGIAIVLRRRSQMSKRTPDAELDRLRLEREEKRLKEMLEAAEKDVEAHDTPLTRAVKETRAGDLRKVCLESAELVKLRASLENAMATVDHCDQADDPDVAYFKFCMHEFGGRHCETGPHRAVVQSFIEDVCERSGMQLVKLVVKYESPEDYASYLNVCFYTKKA